MEWRNEDVLLFLEALQTEPVLWDPKHKKYKNRASHNAAYDRIIEALPFRASTEELKKKKDSLMCYYRVHLNKYKKSLESGAEPSEIYTTNWFAFNTMDSFLRVVYENKNTLDTVGTLTEESSRPTIAATPPISQTSPIIPTKKEKQSSSSNADELMDLATPGLATPHFKEPINESDIIAKGWAIKLNRLTQDQRRYAEKIINDTLFEAEMGTLTRNGVVFLSSSSTVPLTMSPAPPVAASENCAVPASHTSYSSSAARFCKQELQETSWNIGHDGHKQ